MTAVGLFGGRLDDRARRFINLTWTLAVTDWKLRFYGSVLGVAWTLLKPFAFFGVIYVVFVEIVNLGENIINFPGYILLAIVLFNFFSEIATGSVQALVARESLLRKMRFPLVVIPLSIAVGALLNLATTLAAVTIFLLTLGIYPSLEWLQLIPMVVLLLMLGGGLGLLLSALYVRYRDIMPIWEVTTQMLFYASPILYVATTVPSSWQGVYLCNPLAAILTQMRHAIMDPSAPSAAEAIGGAPRLLIPLGLVLGVLALGWWVFAREAPRVAENL
jgi:ABC-2 type transport system permease protein